MLNVAHKMIDESVQNDFIAIVCFAFRNTCTNNYIQTNLVESEFYILLDNWSHHGSFIQNALACISIFQFIQSAWLQFV